MTSVMARIAGPTMLGNPEERAAPAAEIDRELHKVIDTLDVSALALNWTNATYNTQFRD